MSTLQVKSGTGRTIPGDRASLRRETRGLCEKFERAGLNYPCPDCKGAGYQLVNAKIAFPKH